MISLCDGQTEIGQLRALPKGFEAFVTGADGELLYVGKAPSVREASALVRQARAARAAAPAERRTREVGRE